MKPTTAVLSWGLLVFGLLVYLLDRLFVPHYGMGPTSILAAGLILALVVGTNVVSRSETDERERLLQLQADSTALYAVIAGLLAAAIFYPHSQLATAFWAVIGMASLARVIAFFYHHHK